MERIEFLNKLITIVLKILTRNPCLATCNSQLATRNMDINKPISQLPSETRLLIEACRLLCNKERFESFEKVLHEKPNTNKVLQKAHSHGLTPILYHTINKFIVYEFPFLSPSPLMMGRGGGDTNLSHNGNIPGNVLSSLKLSYKQTTYSNTLI